MMHIKDTNLFASLKKTKPRDFIYPGIILLFIILVAILFFISTRFITNNINKILSTSQNAESQSLNRDHYFLTAKKLGISTSTPSIGIAASASTTATTTPGKSRTLPK